MEFSNIMMQKTRSREDAKETAGILRVWKIYFFPKFLAGLDKKRSCSTHPYTTKEDEAMIIITVYKSLHFPISSE